MFDALQKQDIDQNYIDILKIIYYNSTATIKLESTGPSFKISKGVKQGDPLSPKLFTSALEEVFRGLADTWEGRGVDVGGRRLTNLRFADDIILFSTTAAELQLMLQDLSTGSLGAGLMMNMSKTKVMTNSTKYRVIVDAGRMEYVDEYLYLGQIVSFQARQDKEVARRTENAWKSYWSMKEHMKSDLPISLKRKLMDVCILPILTYGAQTWSLTEAQRSSLKICQRAMERSMLGLKRTDRVRNTILRSKTKISDAAHSAAKLKWDWAGHVCRMPDELWAKITTLWQPPTSRRRRGRPRRRWRDELDAFSKDWHSEAQSRTGWKEKREAFAQQWDDVG
ncbi:hypothetical protein O0L34_g2871 [Tuta absoluta]|nr:hypothetical protein O0L34_g2871 [Tuta absoluta]